MLKPPSKHHLFAFGHDIAGNAFIAFRTRGHVDYIYGMFKGKELVGGHLEAIESWHKEGEQIPLSGHPKHGNIVLKMGIPVKEIIGKEAQEIINQMETAP